MGNHFGITKLVVADLEKAAAFYAEVFGVKERIRVQAVITGRPVDEIVYEPTAPGSGALVLLQYADASEPACGETILGFQTDDIEGLFARGLAAGGSVAEPIYEAPEHGVRLGFLADVEGHLIEVYEPLVTSEA
jgi:lactoylglutathione lyase